MRVKNIFTLVFILLSNCCVLVGQNVKPVISNIVLNNNESQKLLTITYDLQDPEEENIEILLRASYDGGLHFLVNTSNATGDIGYPVTIGNNRMIQWQYGNIWDNINGKTLRIIADDKYEISIDEIVNQVDSNNLKTMLNFVSAPRSFTHGSNHLFAVRDTLETRLQSYNYNVLLQEFSFEGHTATNVIGRKSGLKNEENTIVMDAHYDGYANAVGADDNGSGVVGFMEAARILSNYEFDKSLEFIGFDQEENYLLGSINYVYFGGIEPWKKIEGVLNYEMIGYYSNVPESQAFPIGFDLLFPSQYADLVADEFRGNFIFLVGNDASIDLVNAFEYAAQNYVPELKIVSGIVPINGLIAPDLLRSDHAPFWFNGIPAIMITDGANFRNLDYHTVNDVIGNLDFDFMTNIVKTCMATMIDLAGIIHAGSETFVVEDQVTTLYDATNKNCQLMLYPNPAIDRINLQISSCFDLSKPLNASIFDISGKKMLQTSIENIRAQIDLTDLPCGSYIIELNNYEKKQSYPFVIQQD